MPELATALTKEERERIRSQASMSIANLIECYFFWSSGTRRIYARTAPLDVAVAAFFRSSRGRAALPSDAVLLGKYGTPCPARAVLDDLDALITAE
jgi:hypothetical protein